MSNAIEKVTNIMAFAMAMQTLSDSKMKNQVEMQMLAATGIVGPCSNHLPPTRVDCLMSWDNNHDNTLDDNYQNTLTRNHFGHLVTPGIKFNNLPGASHDESPLRYSDAPLGS